MTWDVLFLSNTTQSVYASVVLNNNMIIILIKILLDGYRPTGHENILDDWAQWRDFWWQGQIDWDEMGSRPFLYCAEVSLM